MEILLLCLIFFSVLIQGGYFPTVYLIMAVVLAVALFFQKKRTLSAPEGVLWGLAMVYLFASLAGGYSSESLAQACLPCACALFLSGYLGLSQKQKRSLLDRTVIGSSILAGAAILAFCGVLPLTGAVTAHRLQFTFQYANAAGIWFAAMSLLAQEREKLYDRCVDIPCITALVLTRSVGALGVYGLVQIVRMWRHRKESGSWQRLVLSHTMAVCFAAAFYLLEGWLAVPVLVLLYAGCRYGQKLFDLAIKTYPGGYPYAVSDVSNTGLVWYTVELESLPIGRRISKLGVQQFEVAAPKVQLPRGIQYVPYEYNIDGQTGELAEGGVLPAGLEWDKDSGTLSGMPTEYGTFFFTIGDTDYSLTLLEHTVNYDETLWGSSSENYDIEIAIPSEDGQTVLGAPDDTWEIGGNAWENETMEFKSKGPFDEFEKLWLDGELLEQSADKQLSDGKDYFAEEGSTRLTIRTQTLQNKGDGTHTISAEFRDNSNKLNYSTQNYQLGQSGTTDSNPSEQNPSDQTPTYPSYYPSAPSRYSISTPSTVGGTITVSPTSASSGQTVTLIATPDVGYQLDNLSVFDRNGNRLALTQMSATEFTFTMPSGEVTIQGGFRLTSLAMPFWDVSTQSWYFDAVNYVYQRGLMRGTSETAFEPDIETSRAMFITVLHRCSGGEEEGKEWYSSAQNWAVGDGVFQGDENGELNLFSSISRQELLTMLYRYVGAPAVTGELSAPDADSVSDWAQSAIIWATQTGLVKGFDDGTLRPTATASRAETATFIMRFLEK